MRRRGVCVPGHLGGGGGRDWVGEKAQEEMGARWGALMLDPEHRGRPGDAVRVTSSSLTLLQKKQQ